MVFNADIDIDIAKNKRPLIPSIFGDIITCGSQIDKRKNVLIKHNVAIYFQKIPKDKITGVSAIPYKQSGNYGYFKMDILPLELLNRFKNKDELKTAMNIPPNWKLLEDKKIVSKLFQIKNHFYIVNKVKPKSLIELSDILALMRPEKRKLLDAYIQDKEGIRNTVLYKKESGTKSTFKRCHAIPYAMLIIADMNTLSLVD